MLDLDVRLIMLVLWGGGTVATYARVLWRRTLSWQRHRDQRARRDFAEAVGLFLTALASAASVALVLTAPDIGWHRLASTLALGAFLAVGIYMAQETPTDGR